MKKVRNRITQQQFFNLCTYLSDNEGLLKGRTTKAIRDRILLDIGIDATRSQLLRAQESLGADWIIQRQAREPKTCEPSARYNDMIVIARAVAALYTELGQTAPDDLEWLLTMSHHQETL